MASDERQESVEAAKLKPVGVWRGEAPPLPRFVSMPVSTPHQNACTTPWTVRKEKALNIKSKSWCVFTNQPQSLKILL
jgi:hypothetical protein